MKTKILLIEDDPLVGRMYYLRLMLEGFDVDVASDGEAGLRAIADRPPDAVILDLMLPKIDGIAFLKKLRATPAHAAIPVVVFTSNFLPNLKKDAEHAGATAYLTKSEAGPQELVRTIQKVLLKGITETRATPEAKAPAQGATQELLLACRSLSQELQGDVVNVLKADDAKTRRSRVETLLPKIHRLSSQAALLELPAIAHLASAVEVLGKHLAENPNELSASTLRTLHPAVQLLRAAFDKDECALSRLTLSHSVTLVVDDDAVSRKAVKTALDQCQIQAELFEDPIKAEERLKQTRFDLIISDLNMPGMDGFELCRRLRKHELYSSTPFILITIWDQFENRILSARSGVDDFIAKPLVIVELAVKALTHLLQGSIDRMNRNKPFAPLQS